MSKPHESKVGRIHAFSAFLAVGEQEESQFAALLMKFIYLPTRQFGNVLSSMRSNYFQAESAKGKKYRFLPGFLKSRYHQFIYYRPGDTKRYLLKSCGKFTESNVANFDNF